MTGILSWSPIVFTLAEPWWELILRAVIVYAFLLVLLRLSGKRHVGQLAPFDLVMLLRSVRLRTGPTPGTLCSRLSLARQSGLAWI